MKKSLFIFFLILSSCENKDSKSQDSQAKSELSCETWIHYSIDKFTKDTSRIINKIYPDSLHHIAFQFGFIDTASFRLDMHFPPNPCLNDNSGEFCRQCFSNKTEAIFLFEDESTMLLKSNNYNNCEGWLSFTINNSSLIANPILEKLKSTKILAIRFKDKNTILIENFEYDGGNKIIMFLINCLANEKSKHRIKTQSDEKYKFTLH